MELPRLEPLWQKYRDKGFSVIAVEIARDRERATTFVEENNLTYIGSVPFDPVVQEFNFVGKRLLDLPEDSKAYQVVQSMINKTFLPELVQKSPI